MVSELDILLLLFKTCIYLSTGNSYIDNLLDTIAVTKVVTDFEAAIWKGVRETLFQVEIQACVFTGDKQYDGIQIWLSKLKGAELFKKS